MKFPEFTSLKSNYSQLSSSFKDTFVSVKSLSARDRIVWIWNLLNQYLINRNLFIMILTFIGFLLIEDSFKNIIDERLTSVFKEIEFDYLFDWSILSLFLFTIVSLGRYAFRFYRISFNQFYFFFWVVCIYGYYRFIEEEWIYETFKWSAIESIAYLDILLIPALYPLFFILSFHIKTWKSLQINDFFIEDISINNRKNDILNRLPLAKDLAKKIKQQRFTKSFSVGIIGSWGSGKSSFCNLLKGEIRTSEPNIVLVDFNSFYNHRSEDIIKEFFTTISHSIRPYNGRLSSQIDDYRDNILSLIQEHGIKGIDRFRTLLKSQKTKSVQDQYSNIYKAINALGKKIVVFVDDVDRLRAEEIIQILKIIRNTADFPNTVYFVAFDKEYVVEALEKFAEYRRESFIEKYFQFEFILPPIHKEILRQRFLELIEHHFEKGNLKQISDLITSETFQIAPSFFDKHIHTLRDVARLANTFMFEYDKVNGEVVMNDLMLLLILKNKFISVYEMLARDPLHYLEVSTSTGYENSDEVLELKRDSEKSILQNDIEKKVLYNERMDSVTSLFEALFPVNNYASVHPLSIRIKRNLDKYFKLGDLSGDISNNEFIDCINSNFDRLKESLNKWMKNGQESLVISRIRSEATDYTMITKEQYVNLFDALFYLGLNTEQANVRNYVIDALGKIVQTDELVASGFITEQSEIGERALQLLEKGDETNSDFDFSSWFLFKLINDNKNQDDTYWGVPLKKFQDRQETYFTNFINRLHQAEWQLYYLYHRCYDIGIKQSINDRFKQFLTEEDHKKFLSDIIDRDPFEEIYNISNVVVRIFVNYKEFGHFLDDLPDSPELKEFKIFYRLCSLVNFSKRIYFKFKDILPREYPNTVRIRERMERQLFLKVDEEIDQRLHEKGYDTISEQLKPIVLTHFNGGFIKLENWERMEINKFKEKLAPFMEEICDTIEDAQVKIPRTLKPGESLVTKDNEAIVKVFWYQE